MNMVMNRFEQFSFKKAFVALIMTALVFALMAPLSAKASAADGTYNVDYTVLKDQTNETSRLDSYLTKPAQVTVANGKNVVRLTVKSSNLITAFKVEQNGVLQDATVVSTNTANNTRVVEFEVADLNAKVNAYAEITISVIGYTGKYDVQLQFDEI
ncbi:NEAT domain-containing protein [Paenibacillus sp. P2(2022)]|uniref:NEAT domain-containing protein n=1 Tax=Paenibacillus TaxID=44249 RepID=UPI000301A95F|nr:MULTISPECIES: NEAT domain-containing protein [Paenibacillus]AIY08626.1 cell surface protein [Paenibacillus polymyxa]AUS28545.1 cell surface protein [Paenibacillus polymyxa]KJK29244.1 cell surface protein [Paenibacillus polymyxa]MBY7738727.1 NEAT domain-containing protein [Paenibacillus polymyxa]MDG0055724.1 NEAT domain-containing protein [Paenibacillus sp. P2(2022)]